MTVRYGPGVTRERERKVSNRQAAGDIAASLLSADLPACTQPRADEHRATDWRYPAATAPHRDGKPGPWVCGLCHPPIEGVTVELRVSGDHDRGAGDQR